ncbi:SusC/RagA family TonB-linked outer membrane protein [uncultured Muribaculum sp.]|uniref:SusC/RagA family TonB-linked outer membrane protein n=1 Tax=uncultured Muribaculum sp. TaxID=1918613 RepID=UPI0025D00D5E|nr:SusC/RagA family TonB-linked outer membrane protein [uncultured Muribaculum sp.]
MTKHRILTWLLLLFASTASLCAQQAYMLKGEVQDTSGEPLMGAAVLVKGSNNGVATDIDGNFALNVKQGDIVSVTYVGYKAAEVKVTGQNNIKVTLEENSEVLEEVVVVGYGTMRKKDLTGAVTQINPEKLADTNPGTVQNLLRGTAGLDVGLSNNAKGGGSLQLRGQNSLYTEGDHNSPLIILDGMDFYGELSEINPNDIAQIDVLKDASAAAVYGARAASGVIIITTKKGKLGKPTINVSATLGVSTRAKKRDVWSADDYLKFREDYLKAGTLGYDADNGVYGYYLGNKKNQPGYYDHYDNIGKYGISLEDWMGYDNNMQGKSPYEVYAHRLGMDVNDDTYAAFLEGRSYDWEDEGFRTAFNQDYNASLSGATERANYYFSIGYLNNEGVVKGDRYKSLRASMKINAHVTDWLEIGANVNFQDRTDDSQEADWKAMEKNNPFAPKYNEDGSLRQYPMSMKQKRGHNYEWDRQWQDLEKGYQVLNSIFNAKVTLPFGFTYQFNISPRYQYHQDRWFLDADKPDATKSSRGVNRKWQKRFDWSLNNIITWDKTFNNVHHFVVTLVQEAEERKYWSDGIEARNILPTDELGFHNTENATKVDSKFYTNDTHQSADALMARLFYSYDDRYMLTASIRRDGYSAFGLNNPHATFPSLALAWNFTREKFWKWRWMDQGKLRMSWGKNGNRSLANEYLALADLGSGTGSTMGYLNANGGVAVDMKYLAYNRMANPNLQWEKTEALNYGLDFAFFNYRLSGSIDVYDKKTHDMIMSKPLPGFSGFGSVMTNLGEVTNRGVEITLNSENIVMPDFVWTTNLTFAYNRNRIKHLYYEYDADGKEMDDTSAKHFIGRDINEIWDYRVDGIWSTSEYEEAAKYGQRPGDPKIANVYTADDELNADGTVKKHVYNDKDKVFLGTRTAPYFLSMRNNFTLWKNFDFGFSLYSKFGHKRQSGDYINNINGTSEFSHGFNSYTREYWTPENQSDTYGRWEAKGPNNINPGRIFNAGFVRLDNISMGYTLPQALTRRVMLEKVRFNASINNVAVWAFDWPYNDPENDGFTRRTFSFGVQLTL